jgi:hypothetical protein
MNLYNLWSPDRQCPNALQKTLIYDVGLHKGEDADFYLRKGYQVVAIEANGELVADAKRRFEDAITRGKLHVIHGAVAPMPPFDAHASLTRG